MLSVISNTFAPTSIFFFFKTKSILFFSTKFVRIGLIIFNISELPELSKGKGVILQRYKDGYLEDIKCVSKTNGISWVLSGGRQRVEKDITSWIGKRGGAGKMVPNGFPRPPKFD